MPVPVTILTSCLAAGKTTGTTEHMMVRPATTEEFWAVAELFAALHAFNASLDPCFRLAEGWEALLLAHFERTHHAPGALWLLAWHGSTPVGLLLIEAHSDSLLFAERQWAELVALYVVPAFQGSTLGRTLVERGKQWAACHGFDRMQLYVTASNERAKRFYARCGLYLTQEIWRVDLAPAPGATPPPDPSCEPQGHASQQLELGHHHLAMNG
jgi:GNAT superfamily N-acetyltransferase